MPHLKKAELIEGIVYMPPPVRADSHAEPHSRLGTLLGYYAAETPGVKCFDNASVRLDSDNEPQPDIALLKLPAKGGQARVSADDYIEGAPELVVEIVSSSRAYDLHQKMDVYRRNGVREYLTWITSENRAVWWVLKSGKYRELVPDERGLLKSQVFPGLWLDTAALLRGDVKVALTALREGIESSEHSAFVAG